MLHFVPPLSVRKVLAWDCYIVTESVWPYIIHYTGTGLTQGAPTLTNQRLAMAQTDQSQARAYPSVSIHILNMLIQILKLNLVENIPACIPGKYPV